MKTYLCEDPTEWLLKLLPDLISDILSEPQGDVYSPYIPLQTTPSLIDPADYTLRKKFKFRTKPVRPDFFTTTTVDKLNEPTDMTQFNPPRPVTDITSIRSRLRKFMKDNPKDTPESFTSAGELQETMFRRALESLTQDGILGYDAEQKGWWRPEVLDVLAALDKPVTSSEEPLARGPSRSEKSSPSGDETLGACSAPPS